MARPGFRATFRGSDNDDVLKPGDEEIVVDDCVRSW